ncbi:hypothetical protein HRH25_23805 [Flavisolibacter sp. BT320]|nr:hypothetical protein [Flavisolibacter longurius]
MFGWIRKILAKRSLPAEGSTKIPLIKHHRPVSDIKFVWSIVGNVVDQHYYGENKELKRGTKHFSPNTKVYCFPPMWGDAYENIKVIGRHRKSKRFIILIMPSAFITNWRLEKVYSPYIVREMYSQKGWTDMDEDRDTIQEMLSWLPQRTKAAPPK